MYIEIMNEIKSFLASIFIDTTIIDTDIFQGILIKKLSNQNIIRSKRNVPVGSTISPVKQTHLDITGNKAMLFFFENLSNTTTNIQDIDIDVFSNNLDYLNSIDTYNCTTVDTNIVFSRANTKITNLKKSNIIYHSTAFKKHGHTGNQVQLNIPDLEEPFTKLHKLAYVDDALVMLRYNYFHYLAIIIPGKLCRNLYSLTQTSGNQNVNVTILNPSYNSHTASRLQREQITPYIKSENEELESLQNTLSNSLIAGTDVEKIMKSRVSQGAFRRMLMLIYHHKCCLCDITTTAVLRASHIKSWSASSKEERMDANNGLLLCANHDALFDKHLISFNPDTGMIIISSSVDEDQRNALNISDTLALSLSSDMRKYMSIHHKSFIEKENN